MSINLKKVITIPIAPALINFFINNRYLLFLKNEEEIIYETPIIAYYKEGIDVYREIINTHLGKCYYFYSGIPNRNRVALFLQKHNRLARDNLLYDTICYDTIFYKNENNETVYAVNNYNQYTLL